MAPETHVHHEEGVTPLVLSMPHSAITVPANLSGPISEVFNFDDPDAQRTLSMGADYAVPEITDFHYQTRHSRVWTTLPRTLVDVNRGADEVDGESVEGRGDARHTHGLIWHGTIGKVEDVMNPEGAEIKPILKRPYTEAEYQELLEAHYNPYGRAVRAAMDDVLRKHGFAILLDCHTLPAHQVTMTPERAYIFGQEARRGTNVPRELPDLIMITNGGESCHPAISDVIRETFRDAGLIVMDGVGPFKGDKGSTVLYSAPKEGKNVVGLEFVSHNLEIGRANGTIEVNKLVAAEVRTVFEKVFSQLEGIGSGGF